MNDDELNPAAMDALRARFEQQSRKAQAYYNVMHAVRSVAGSDDAANAWMNAPLAAFDGKTPAQAVAEGREAELLAYVRAL
jgi:uncharacterized protein (DUF2384 family)